MGNNIDVSLQILSSCNAVVVVMHVFSTAVKCCIYYVVWAWHWCSCIGAQKQKKRRMWL